jgi:hypothetical protein
LRLFTHPHKVEASTVYGFGRLMWAADRLREPQEITTRLAMYYRRTMRAVSVALATALAMTISSAQSHDDMSYPYLKGQWSRLPVPGVIGPPSFDQNKAAGKAQQAPLTPEYQAIFEASLVDQANGGHGNSVDYAKCIAGGMPHMMAGYQPLEFIALPETTYIVIGDQDHLRRIFTDGREWPKGHRTHLSGLFNWPMD